MSFASLFISGLELIVEASAAASLDPTCISTSRLCITDRQRSGPTQVAERILMLGLSDELEIRLGDIH
jgi:hypothetical protein